MSYSQSRHTYQPETFPPYSAHDTNTPPPPPPKPSNHETDQTSAPPIGPPLPPIPSTIAPQTSYQKYQVYEPQDQYRSPQSQPPSFEDGWLPDILKDKSKTDLAHVLSSQSLLSALLHAPSTSHPSLPASLVPIQNALTTNIALAREILNLANTLTSIRRETETKLLRLHALERQWRLKQTALDDALQPWSPKALHQRLVAGIGEQEAWLQALEASLLEGDGRAGERELGEFLKRWREGRRVLELRAERRERWEEGRVGGWR